MDAKHFILGNKKTLRETCIMNILQFHNNHEAKNAKTSVYGEVSKVPKC